MQKNDKGKRIIRTRAKLKKVNKNRLRLAVFRSSKNIYAQIIDDKISKTIVSASSSEKGIKTNTKVNKTELSKIVAKNLFKRASEKKINLVYFDRGKYKYHGRLKVFAEVLRSEGMKFWWTIKNLKIN